MKYMVAVLAVMSLNACSPGPQLSSLDNDAVILAVGDSLTAGKGVAKIDSYPSVLAQLSGRQVINAGVSGETTEQGQQRLPLLLKNYQPDLVILLEGGNDILRNIPAAEIKANLQSMIELIQQHNSDIVLVSVPEKKLFSSSAPWYAELAKTHNIVLEESIIADLLGDRHYKSDSVHFNNAGYRELAMRLYDTLEAHGAIGSE